MTKALPLKSTPAKNFFAVYSMKYLQKVIYKYNGHYIYKKVINEHNLHYIYIS